MSRRTLLLWTSLLVMPFGTDARTCHVEQPEPAFHVEHSVQDVEPTRATLAWTSRTECIGRVEYGISQQLGQVKEEFEPVTRHKVTLEGLEPDTCYYYRIVSGEQVGKIEIVKTPRLGFHVHPYLQLPTTSSMTVMWETNDRVEGHVEYGLTESLGQKAEEGKGATRLHQVKIDNLQPGTSYFYRVRCGKLLSDTHAFRTAPPAGTMKWKMAYYGDSRSNPNVHARVVEQIVKQNVDLILHTGDIVVDGRNYQSWRREWFGPIAPLAATVPWVSTIGNHERDAANYFSYAALPGNERYYAFDYANARIVCLDSNGWLERGRDSRQYAWMEQTLKGPSAATWTFVAFHHPLFSAHRTRGINSLRWNWAPLFLDPACKVDGVLNGHDHFYARNHPMVRLATGPQRGVQFMTSAGGGASLYPIRERDYLEKIKSIHHFTLFEFDGDRINASAIDLNGNVFDRFTWTKEPTPPERLAAYEVEELREFLRKALLAAPTIEVSASKENVLDTVLEVPQRFQVPLEGSFQWAATAGWSFPRTEIPFRLQPGEPLRIPLQATVTPAGLGTTPKLTIAFSPGRFRNRMIDIQPFKLTGPASITPPVLPTPCPVDGQLEAAWQQVPAYPLLATTGSTGGPASQVQLATDGEQLLVAARLVDPQKKVVVPARGESKASSQLVLFSEHVRVEIHDGKVKHVFALSAEQIPYYSAGSGLEPLAFPAEAKSGDGYWTAELAIPLKLFADRSQLRINVVHRNGDSTREAELRPGYALGQNPDVIPDWKAATGAGSFARLVVR